MKASELRISEKYVPVQIRQFGRIHRVGGGQGFQCFLQKQGLCQPGRQAGLEMQWDQPLFFYPIRKISQFLIK